MQYKIYCAVISKLLKQIKGTKDNTYFLTISPSNYSLRIMTENKEDVIIFSVNESQFADFVPIHVQLPLDFVLLISKLKVKDSLNDINIDIENKVISYGDFKHEVFFTFMSNYVETIDNSSFKNIEDSSVIKDIFNLYKSFPTNILTNFYLKDSKLYLWNNLKSNATIVDKIYTPQDFPSIYTSSTYLVGSLILDTKIISIGYAIDDNYLNLDINSTLKVNRQIHDYTLNIITPKLSDKSLIDRLDEYKHQLENNSKYRLLANNSKLTSAIQGIYDNIETHEKISQIQFSKTVKLDIVDFKYLFGNDLTEILAISQYNDLLATFRENQVMLITTPKLLPKN